VTLEASQYRVSQLPLSSPERTMYGDMGGKPEPSVIKTIVATDSEDSDENGGRKRERSKRKKHKSKGRNGSRGAEKERNK